VRQYTKMDHRLEHQDNPGLMVSRLLQVAMSEQQGPVYLSVPRETAMLPLPGVTRFPTRDQLGLARPSWPDPDDARDMARWLVKSSNPLILAERIGRDPKAVAELVRLAELLAVPVLESRQADRLNFPMTHDLYETGPQVRDADVVLVFDCIAPFIPGVDSPKPDAKVAWIGPDPVMTRYKTMEFRADLRIAATPVNVIRAIHDAAEKILDASDLARIADRRRRLGERKRQAVAEDERRGLEAGGKPMPTTRWVACQLGKILEPDAILLNDGVSSSGLIRTYSKRQRPLTHFRSGSSAGGWAPGAAFGAKIAAPDRDVVLAGGDGFYAFGTPSSALWAARRHKAPFLSVVFANSAYSTGTTGLAGMYPDGYAVKADCEGGTFEPAPDFAKIAESAGAYGENVTETAKVGPALARGLKHVRDGNSAVIAVKVPSPFDERGA
jgi:acetolactate synthase-1/2/3 large subunit